jgi:hypothetical protein
MKKDLRKQVFFYSASKESVGATIGRPLILHGKISRRKAKDRLFSFGKSEKLRFSADEQCSPLRFIPATKFFACKFTWASVDPQ